MEEIDTGWISDFEKTDKKYEAFYKDTVPNINLFFMYVDRNSNLFYIKKEKIKLQEGVLNKDLLIQILKENMEYNKKNTDPFHCLNIISRLIQLILIN